MPSLAPSPILAPAMDTLIRFTRTIGATAPMTVVLHRVVAVAVARVVVPPPPQLPQLRPPPQLPLPLALPPKRSMLLVAHQLVLWSARQLALLSPRYLPNHCCVFMNSSYGLVQDQFHSNLTQSPLPILSQTQ